MIHIKSEVENELIWDVVCQIWQMMYGDSVFQMETICKWYIYISNIVHQGNITYTQGGNNWEIYV